jgi:hypothetical protein
MRLINTATLQLEEFFDKDIPKYGILSHTWQQNEVTLVDYDQRIHRKRKRIADEAVTKIRSCCRQAAEDGHGYVWIDTCCIDKKSSAELSEAINSMFRWYRDTQMCYVYFSDVTKQPSWEATADLMRKARWFTRGWTLQELLAPWYIKFYDCNWDFLGGRWRRVEDGGKHCFSSPWHPFVRGTLQGDRTFPGLLADITNIDIGVLRTTASIDHTSVARRMSWAAHRVTTRKEDMAYCLLGLFDVNMPLLYGEGDKAFARLQAAIMASTDDHTLFAWNYGIASTHSSRRDNGCLALSVSEFKNGHLLSRYNRDGSDTFFTTSHHSLTNLGVHITLPVIELPHMHGMGVLAALTCTDVRAPYIASQEHVKTYVVAIPLYCWGRNTNLFSRTHLQTRPLLVEPSLFQGSYVKPMYIQTIAVGFSNYYRDDDRLTCTVGGIELSITERFPYFIQCTIDRSRNEAGTGQVCSFTIDLEVTPGIFVPPADSILTVGFKFASPYANVTGNGSFFVLMQYNYAEADPSDQIVGRDFRILSGSGYSSLTSLMLDEKAVAAVFETPAEHVELQNLDGSNSSDRLRCRQLPNYHHDEQGYNFFDFCLEVV